MLCGVGNEERYKDRRKDPNDMVLDAAEKEDDDQDVKYSAAEWAQWTASEDDDMLSKMQAQKDEIERQMDYLG